MSVYHRFMQIQAYKHDGSFHRCWSHGFVVRDDEDYIVVVSNRTRVVESNCRSWHTKEKAVFIFSKKEWFNTIATFLEEGGVRFYVNIASPAIIDNNYIKFIDYDLDLKLFPTGFTKVLDVNEFNAHCEKYGYSSDLKRILENAVNENIEKFKNKQEPYQEEMINKYIADFDKYVARQEEQGRKRQNQNNENKVEEQKQE